MLTEDTYPVERVDFMRKEVGCDLVLDQALYEHIMKEYEPKEGFEDVDDHDLAYVVYTSGSTGAPKGVLHEYGNLDQASEVVPEPEGYPVVRYALVHPLHFVAAILCFTDAMMAGMSIYIVPSEVYRNFEQFSRFLEENRISTTFLPPSFLRMYKHPVPSLIDIEAGSEPAHGLYYEGGKPRIINKYSMSEAGYCILCKVLDRAYDVAPVGKPLMPIRLGLLGEDGREVEGPGEGELFFESPYVRGYINRPELTARAFRDGMYYTGDICRRDENGDYYIVGRNDDMVKINGNRIEPAEIEAAIKSLTDLSQVAAKGFNEPGRSFICAYYVQDEAKSRMDAELATARAIQEDALPRRFPPFPEIRRFEVFALIEPARAVRDANVQICDSNETGMFVTSWICVLDYVTGRLEYVNAGHNPPLLRQSNGDHLWLRKKSGPVLGMFPGDYVAHSIRCAPGDMIVLYTDGVTESENKSKAQYGEQRLLAFAEGASSLGPRAFVEGLRADVEAWADGTEQSDDITLLALELRDDV